MELKSLADWKKYFQSANTSIYTIIDNAIRVAASDNLNDFKLRRGNIAEKIYSCSLHKCCCNDDLKVKSEEKDGKSGGNCNDFVVCDDERRSPSNEERVSVDEISKYSSGEVEALVDAMEEHSANTHNVLRIKESLENSHHLTEAEIIEALRKLQLMVLSVQVLGETLIAETVYKHVKHCSEKIRLCAKTIVSSWATMVKEYVKFTNNLGEDQSKDSNSSLRDDDAGGLPIPPMDKGILLLSHQPPIDLSEFFNGVDGNENPEASLETKMIHQGKNNAPRGNKRKLELEPRDNNEQIKKPKREPLEKMTKPTNEKNPEKDYESKLEMTKRKLFQSYQEANKAKRNTKMITDFPKDSTNCAFSRRKSGWNCKV